MKAVICLLLVSIGLVAPLCDPGWTQFREDCIWFSHAAKIWVNAELDCRHKHGWLMTDDSEDKHDFISSIVYAFRSFHFTHFFIGGSDVAFENQWRWIETGINVNSTSSAFTKWGTNEPDGNNSKNCLALKWQGDRNLIWSDESCGAVSSHHNHHVHGAMNYICEKPVSSGGSSVIGR